MQVVDGYHDVPPGKLAAVVTCLEMLERPALQPERAGLTCRLERKQPPETRWYRDLFARVGENVLWYSRLEMSDRELDATLRDPRIEVYAAVDGDGRDVGLLELDFRGGTLGELSFFGLLPEAIGKGIGGWLINRAVERAWEHPIERFWVHTCTLDQPGIVQFYERAGFRPFKRQVEIFDDPRVMGKLPRNAAPHVPIL